MFENIYHIEIFGIHQSDQKVLNMLLKDGWQILSIIQYKADNMDAYGQIILGASKAAFERNNLKIIHENELSKKAEEEEFRNIKKEAELEKWLALSENDIEDKPF
ncbi:hypothetical protein [Enterococcus gilvus]|uniref:hypothetical protein n=1 Tax=Enterococcus gilvus TaxID=160453 RepID=UPI003EDA868E